MKIISNFKDYYDSVMRSGMDPNIVYVRDSEKIPLKVRRSFRDSTIPDRFHQSLYNLICLDTGGRLFHQTNVLYLGDKSPSSGLQAHLFAVVVGGESIYRGIRVHLSVDSDLYFYTSESFEEFLKKSETYINMFLVNIHNIREFFSRSSEDSLVSQYCREKCIPVCLVMCESDGGFSSDPVVINNPFLKDIEFYRVMDPYTIFQEIQAAVSNMSFKEKTLVEISDRCKIEGHGFDYKKSFRKGKKE